MDFAYAVLKMVKMFNRKPSREKRASTKTILIVEDAPHIQRLIQVNLQRQGYGVLLAETGTEAITLVETHRPDLLIIDMILPDMNGFEFLARLKEKRYNQTLPIVALTPTAQDHSFWWKEWNAGGMWLSKPIMSQANPRGMIDLLSYAERLFTPLSTDDKYIEVYWG